MAITEEKFAFEMSEEVKEKIEHSETVSHLINEEELADLQYVELPGAGYRFVKRAADIALSVFGLLVLLIPMLFIALAIYIDDPGKVLFRQYRVGRNGKRFKLYKFRTMKMETPKYLSTAEVDDPQRYITKVGGFLRKASLDELPQFINVLKGDMSLIGPRPLISDEYEIHSMRMKLGVYNIRPGVTGLAQINGRDLVGPADKVRWDVKYVENFGLKMDLKILFSSVLKIFKAEGVVEGAASCNQAQQDEETVSEEVPV